MTKQGLYEIVNYCYLRNTMGRKGSLQRKGTLCRSIRGLNCTMNDIARVCKWVWCQWVWGKEAVGRLSLGCCGLPWAVFYSYLPLYIYIYVYTQSTVWLYIRRVAQLTFRFDNHAAWFETFRKRLKLRKLSGAVPNYPKAVRNRFELLESCPELLPS